MVFKTKFKFIFLLIIFTALTGCKQKLYGDLDEFHANDMVYVLANNGIHAERNVVDGKYSILVDESKIPEAIRVLKAEGYPKRTFSSLGTIFNDSNLINTTFQEHARFVYAISEELAESITNIPGVSEARVHIMLPQVSQITNKRNSNPSASIFIYAEEMLDSGNITSVVKDMVTHAVDNMKYENVAVAIFETKISSAPQSMPESEQSAVSKISSTMTEERSSNYVVSLIDIFRPELLALFSLLAAFFFLIKAFTKQRK